MEYEFVPNIAECLHKIFVDECCATVHRRHGHLECSTLTFTSFILMNNILGATAVTFVNRVDSSTFINTTPTREKIVSPFRIKRSNRTTVCRQTALTISAEIQTDDTISIHRQG